jgi:hypothetical protein
MSFGGWVTFERIDIGDILWGDPTQYKVPLSPLAASRFEAAEARYPSHSSVKRGYLFNQPSRSVV